MLTIKNSQVNNQVDTSGAISAQLIKALKLTAALFLVAIAGYVCFVNLWLGVVLTTGFILLRFRKTILFFFYVLSLDFTLGEDIFKDLEDM